jgi:hypothetical protein
MDRSSQATRLAEAKQFLMENPTESKTVAARIFDINNRTLIISMRRESNRQHEGHNKILNEHEEKSVHRLIESLLTHDMSFIINVVFGDIVTFKLTQNVSSSSESWFRK